MAPIQPNRGAHPGLGLRSLLAYLALLAGVFVTSPIPELVGVPAAVLAILLGWRDVRTVPRLLLVLTGLAGLAALIFEPAALATAAANGARLAALLIAVMLLASMLGTSRDLDIISRRLFAGRALPRYLSITFGTGFLALPLNIGSVSVVGTMIGREMERQGDSTLTRNAARAVLRGFGSASIGSPLSISVVVALTFLPGLPGWQLLALSLPLAVGYLLLGAVFREGGEAAPTTTGSEGTSAAPWLRFTGCIGVVCLGAFALSGLTAMDYSRAVALSCVITVTLGLLIRRTRGEKVRLPSLARVSNELTIVGASAFLGALASVFALYLLGAGFTLPAWAYPIAAFVVPWALFAGGLVGLNPIVTGTLIGGIFSPIWPPSAMLGLGIAMVTGWGLATAGTPYSANSLLINRLTGYSANTAAFQWNLGLSLASLLFSGLLAATLTAALAG